MQAGRQREALVELGERLGAVQAECDRHVVEMQADAYFRSLESLCKDDEKQCDDDDDDLK